MAYYIGAFTPFFPVCLSLALSGQFVPILLVISTSSMLLLDQRTLQIKYRVPASEVYRLSLSPYADDIAVFHVKAVSRFFSFIIFYFVARKLIQLDTPFPHLLVFRTMIRMQIPAIGR